MSSELSSEQQRAIVGCAITCGCVALAIYRETGYPSVGGGDSGELLAEACVGGVAHPPGYGLYLAILGWLIALGRPWLSPGRVGALFSAACSSVAVAGVGAAAGVSTRSLGEEEREHAALACLVAAGCFATTPLVWEYAVQAEVFALNNAICALGLAATAAIDATTSAKTARKWSIGGAILVGLGAAHQQASLLSAVPLGLTALARMRRQMTPTRLAELVAAALAAWAVPTAVVLPARSLKATEGSWGDLTTWRGFVRHISRAEYGA